MDTSQENFSQLGDLITDLLCLSRLDAVPMEFAPLDLAELLYLVRREMPNANGTSAGEAIALPDA